jgi:hypothetical protein
MAQVSSEPPYGPTIITAISRGDLCEMKALAQSAEAFLTQHGDVKALLEVLKIEIARLSGTARPGGIIPARAAAGAPPTEPDYGPPIQEAIARGDLHEMKALLSRAEDTLKQQGDLATAVAQLRTEIAKLERH